MTVSKSSKISLPLLGGCQCGQLRYTITELPSTLYCCHCTECQGQAASAFGMSLRVAGDSVQLEGEHGSYIRDEGKPSAAEGVFCSKCGSRVIHRGRDKIAGVSIKAGSLDDTSWLEPVGHIWTKSAQKWMKFEGLTYETQPDDGFKALNDAFIDKFGS